MESNSAKVLTPKSHYELTKEQNISDRKAKFDSLKLEEKVRDAKEADAKKNRKNKVSKKSDKKESIAIRSSQRLKDQEIINVSGMNFECASCSIIFKTDLELKSHDCGYEKKLKKLQEKAQFLKESYNQLGPINQNLPGTVNQI